MPSRVEHARGLAARVDERAELVEQAGGAQRRLAVVLVDVEHAALRARVGRGLGLEDGGGDAVDVEDAREHQPAEAGADDRDGMFMDDFVERCSMILEQRSIHVKMRHAKNCRPRPAATIRSRATASSTPPSPCSTAAARPA